MHIVRFVDSRNTAAVVVAIRTLVLLGTLLGIASCGVRTAVSAESDWEDAHDAGPKLLACGYGPPCNPRNFGGQTCTSLGLKPGALSCDPKTCFLVLTGCGKTTSGGGAGSGGGSTNVPSPGTTTPPVMDAGPLFGGLFGTGAAGTGAPAMPGGLPMADDDGGVPGFFGNGFFGAGFFGGNQGAGNAGNQGAGIQRSESNADDPGNR